MKRFFFTSYSGLRLNIAHACILPGSLRLLLVVLMVLGAFALTPAVYAQGNTHVVQRGENLATIAARYGTTVSALIAANGLANPNVIYVGQRLAVSGSGAAGQTTGQLPGGDGYYTVQRGDSLSTIASRHGMTQADLMRLNGLSNANLVWTGQQLRVSARVAAVQPAQAAPQLAGDIYIVQPGDALSTIASRHGTTAQALLIANGLPNANFVWVGQRLRVTGIANAANPVTPAAAAPATGGRWIEVNLSNQTLTAWQGDVSVMHTSISSGLANTPTVTGRYPIKTKYSSQHMSGPGYSLPGVPWVMYFYSGYAIHGAYWHDNFGQPMSHGCVNMRVGEAGTLYDWASVGTEVYVHY